MPTLQPENPLSSLCILQTSHRPIFVRQRRKPFQPARFMLVANPTNCPIGNPVDRRSPRPLTLPPPPFSPPPVHRGLLPQPERRHFFFGRPRRARRERENEQSRDRVGLPLLVGGFFPGVEASAVDGRRPGGLQYRRTRRDHS